MRVRYFVSVAALLGSAFSSFAAGPTLPVGGPSLPVEVVQFSGLWRGVQFELDMVSCASTECSSAVAELRAIGPAFEAGGDVWALHGRLEAAQASLDKILARELGPAYSDGRAYGLATFGRVRRAVPSSTLLPEGGDWDQCTADCLAAFTATALVCSVLPPPFNAGCAAGALISLGVCYAYCEATVPPAYWGGGGWPPSGDDPGDPGCGVEDCGYVARPARSAIAAAAVRLALRFSPCQLSVALPFAISLGH